MTDHAHAAAHGHDAHGHDAPKHPYHLVAPSPWPLLGSIAGSIVVGLIIYGVKVSALRIPGEKATDIGVVLYAVPGSLIGMALIYLEGMRRERTALHRQPE